MLLNSAERPDVLLLQETKVHNEAFPTDFFEDRGYTTAFFGQKSYNGVAIASLWRIEDTREIVFPSAPEDARYIQGFTAGMMCASVYVPNGRELHSSFYDAKGNFFEHLRAHSQTLLKAYRVETVLGGDFNVAPFSRDIMYPQQWQGRLLCSAQEQAWMRELLSDGWIDALDREGRAGGLGLEGERKNDPTWWDYRSGALKIDNGLRIDMLLLSPCAADRCVSSRVLKTFRELPRPSDHAPISVVLD